MSFDKPTRNKLASMVGDCRRLLTDDIRHQLQAVYGLQPDGTALPALSLSHLDERGREVADALRLWQEHLASTEVGTEPQRRKAAFDRLTHETAFTILNRLAALRMCEERGHVIECVRRGMESDGFALYERFSEGVLGGRGETYRIFLERMFAELSVDLGALFDLDAPQSLVFPRERCLEQVLSLLNKADFSDLWGKDETIGWIYQYFNSKEEREAMRDASDAPRNSRELAVRNQFFTPRYVVEFLVDNTLGRIWYEVRHGDTALKETCQYLVRRPKEVFLSEAQQPPQSPEPQENPSQDELLNQPFYIPYRAKRDPRTLKVLDPAVGSGHFLLYAFDLLEVIYEEAWEDTEQQIFETTGKTLREDYADLSALKTAIPELIIRHNLHGIDIDLRACQIAPLALWLRAQLGYQSLGLKRFDRPKITRSNIVCAEPMPGEQTLLDQFLTELEPKVIGQLVRVVFEKMKLAGEAGFLLKIEDEIANSVANAKEKWLSGPKPEQGLLFADAARPQQRELSLDFSGITDQTFWERAEERIYAALQSYAEHAENGHGYQRRLFADDAARGFAFIDLCRKRYDVVLMNPPFGLPVDGQLEWLKSRYTNAYVDLYAAAVARGLELAPAGLVGCITSRSFMFAKTLTDWREKSFLTNVSLVADLGSPVMDTAVVQSCAYVMHPRGMRAPICVTDCRAASDKGQRLAEVIRTRICDHFVDRQIISQMFRGKFLYNIGSSVRKLLFRDKSKLGDSMLVARQGLKTFNDFRFLRLHWEVPYTDKGPKARWEPITRGGGNELFYSDIFSLVLSAEGGRELAAENFNANGQTAQSRQASRFYRLPGATYTWRAQSFKVAALPGGVLIGGKGPVAIPIKDWSPSLVTGILDTSVMRALVELQANANQYESGIVESLPTPNLNSQDIARIELLSGQAILLCRALATSVEESTQFSCCRIADTIKEIEGAFALRAKDLSLVLGRVAEELDQILSASLGLIDDDIKDLRDAAEIDFSVEFDHFGRSAGCNVISYCVGATLGRWDVRYAMGENAAPELPDPFAPLPVCPPAMLRNDLGLPLTEENVRNLQAASKWRYPVEISWDGILVDDSDNINDIVRRVREILTAIWKEHPETIEQEVCEILELKDLREYFRKPSLFFADHLRRYFKSHRQAPIYWPLSTVSGSYTLWIYYHRLNDDSLYTALNKYVKPKIDTTEKELRRMESELPHATGRDASSLRTAFEEAKVFLDELTEFRDELARVADLPYKPNLNDGVLITAAPLWKLFRLPKWRKDLQECWKKLEAGEYDWAHLAYSIWPDRVRDVCKSDRSIALAHDLESLCEVAAKPAKKKRSKKISVEETVPGDEE